MADQVNKVDLRHSLDRLFDVIASRKDDPPDDSYTAQMFASAPPNSAHKLCEEATEVLIEALNHNKVNLTAESADLLYHLLVVWAVADIDPQDVWQELDHRQGTSGLVEKQNRRPE